MKSVWQKWRYFARSRVHNIRFSGAFYILSVFTQLVNRRPYCQSFDNYIIWELCKENWSDFVFCESPYQFCSLRKKNFTHYCAHSEIVCLLACFF